jgi:hypothetical protein
VAIDDAHISELLDEAQHEAVESSLTLLRATRALEVTKQRERLDQEGAAARAETERLRAALDIETAQARLGVALAALDGSVREAAEHRRASEAKSAVLDFEHQAALRRERLAAEERHTREAAAQALRLEALSAEVESVVRRFQAAQGGLSDALVTLSNRDTLARVAEAMSVQSFIGGKSLTDVIDKVFAGSPLEGLLEKVKVGTAVLGPASGRSDE